MFQGGTAGGDSEGDASSFGPQDPLGHFNAGAGDIVEVAARSGGRTDTRLFDSYEQGTDVAGITDGSSTLHASTMTEDPAGDGFVFHRIDWVKEAELADLDDPDGITFDDDWEAPDA